MDQEEHVVLVKTVTRGSQWWTVIQGGDDQRYLLVNKKGITPISPGDLIVMRKTDPPQGFNITTWELVNE